jgi:NDP-sugar pyrophosphorylase family protein
MKAMIFAAGLGKRLGEITLNLPKALVDIDGKTALQIVVEKLSGHGFDDIIINVHHFAEKIELEIEKLRKRGFKITISDERDLLLDTGGGLRKAKWFFDENPFLLYNVDIMTDLDLTAIYRFHLENKGLATLAVRNRHDEKCLLVDRKGLLHGWFNKTTNEEIISGLKPCQLFEIAFSGIHIVNPEIFNYMDDGVYSLTTLYLKLAADHAIHTFKHNEGYWSDIGTAENLNSVRKYYGSIP